MTTKKNEKRKSFIWALAIFTLVTCFIVWEANARVFQRGPMRFEDVQIDTAVTTTQSFISSIIFEGATADAYETTLSVTDPPADVTYQFPTGTAGTYYPMVSTLATNQVGIANSIWGATGSTLVAEGATADASETTIGFTDPTADVIYQFPTGTAGTYYPMISTLATNQVGIANSIWGTTTGLIAEGATADGFEITLSFSDATADSTVTVPADNTGNVSIVSSETVAATNVLTSAECGKTSYLNHATEFVSTLPALSTVSAGCEFEFIVANAPESASYTVITGNSLENLIYGLVVVNGATVAGSTEDTITFVDGNATIGDWAKVRSDGTSWFVKGQGSAATSITLTQAD
jgi:hypothetical protein